MTLEKMRKAQTFELKTTRKLENKREEFSKGMEGSFFEKTWSKEQ